MLLTKTKTIPGKQQMRVCHVASGTVTASLEIVGMPTIPKGWASEEAGRVKTEMYMPCKAQAVLVPESLQVIALRRLPSLGSMAQIAAPEFGGQPASLLRMGWADQDSLIVLVWEAADAEVVVTVHVALSGASLQHMLHLTPHDPHHPLFTNENVLRAFAASPDDAVAAVAWQSGGPDIHVALLDLACGTQTHLQCPVNRVDRGICYSEGQAKVIEFAWSPGAGFLMVYEYIEGDSDVENWAIFTSPAGVFVGPQAGRQACAGPPVWSSHHPFCLIGPCMDADERPVDSSTMDLSIVPPCHLSYGRGQYVDPWDTYPETSVLVPGTRDLVVFWPGSDFPDCPIQHWTFDSSKGSSVWHDVSGLNRDLAGAFVLSRMAWQLTTKSAAIYALVDFKANGALHLIDAQKHRRLITWTSEQMASMLQGPMSLEYASLAWSFDGNELAVITKTGTAIFSFPFKFAADLGW